MWRPVPWFVAGGDHSAEVARLLAYAATGGAEGVIESGDCKITALDIPANAVRMAIGAVTIPNRAPTGRRQSYVEENPSVDTITMTAVGSGGPRSDLIIGRIEDPDYSGTSPAENPAAGPYMFTRVVENVPVGTERVQEIAGHTTDSAVTLAIVTRPANTGTVLPQHITDLRKVANERRQRAVAMVSGPPAGVGISVEPPNYQTMWTVDADIPSWATHVNVIAHIAGVELVGRVSGYARLTLGDSMVGADIVYEDRGAASQANPVRIGYVMGLAGKLPAGYAGTTRTIGMLQNKTSPQVTAFVNGATTIIFEYEFYAAAV